MDLPMKLGEKRSAGANIEQHEMDCGVAFALLTGHTTSSDNTGRTALLTLSMRRAGLLRTSCSCSGAVPNPHREPIRAQIVHRTFPHGPKSTSTSRTIYHEAPAQSTRAGRRWTHRTAPAQLKTL